MAFEASKPPWIDDPDPTAWVRLRDAAQTFRKSPETIRQLAVTKTLPSYFDGSCWWVRLDISQSSNSAK